MRKAAAISHASRLFVEPTLQGKDSPDPWSILVCTALALQQVPGRGASILQQFLRSLLLPVLSKPAALPSAALHTQVSTALCDLLLVEAHWGLVEGILTACGHTLAALSAGTKQEPPSGAPALSLHAVCCLLPTVLARCAGGSKQPQQKATSTAVGPQQLPRKSLELLLSPAVGLLASSNGTHRRAAMRSILPPLLAAAETLGTCSTDNMLLRL
jgi:hypothetical protein